MKHPPGYTAGYAAGRAAGYAAGYADGQALATMPRAGGYPLQPAPRRPASSYAAPEMEPADPGFTSRDSARAVSLPHGRVLPPMRGSHESLVRQNERSDADGLERIEDERDLRDRIASKLLVPVPASAALTVNGNLPESHRYCRPWTATFLRDLARAHAVAYRRPVEVNSAVRTVAYQKRLAETNGNAAAAEGDVVSPHLTGATVDITKKGMTQQEIGWMRAWLLPLQRAGKIDVEEEFQQACFHITVYRSYAPPRAARRTGSQNRAAGQTGPRPSGTSPRRAGQPRKQQNPAPPSDEIASRDL
jgi:hypothetical protein